MDEQMKERIQAMARLTWDYIGGDYLTVTEEQGLEPVLDRETVVEVVCDASYMKTHGQDEEAYNVWNKIPTYKEKMDVVKGAFPFEKYGW